VHYNSHTKTEKNTEKNGTKQVIFKLAFKTAVSLLSRRSAGREFHTDGPATETEVSRKAENSQQKTKQMSHNMKEKII